MSTQTTAIAARPAGRGATRNTLRRRILASRLPKSARTVGLVLAELMVDGPRVRATNRRIAKAAGVSERTVQRATTELVRRRYIRRTRRDRRFAWTYEPVAPRGATTSSRGVVVSIRGDTVATQGDAMSPRSTVSALRFSVHEDPKPSSTRKAKAEPGSKAKAAAAAPAPSTVRLKSLTPEEAEALARQHPELSRAFATTPARGGR